MIIVFWEYLHAPTSVKSGIYLHLRHLHPTVAQKVASIANFIPINVRNQRHYQMLDVGYC